MKKNIKITFNLFFFILITNTNFLEAHDSFNGGCNNHCNDSVKPLAIEKKLNNVSNKNQIEDNDSCLSKSLCRG